jgi:hypothetical protein
MQHMMSPYELALRCGVSRYELEDEREQMTDEQWTRRCEELMTLCCYFEEDD